MACHADSYISVEFARVAFGELVVTKTGMNSLNREMLKYDFIDTVVVVLRAPLLAGGCVVLASSMS